jgi:hypothetical protein
MTDAPDWTNLFHSDHEPDFEDLAAGGTHLLDLVAAVDFLRRGDRIGLTVWEALEEAIRWWVAERLSAIDGVPDPEMADLRWADHEALHHALSGLLAAAQLEPQLSVDLALHQAIRRWAHAMSSRHIGGAEWPHPNARPKSREKGVG